MTNRTSSTDLESAHWQESEEFYIAVSNFDTNYAMPPENLKISRAFHECVLDKFFKYVDVCTDIRRIGGSYEGVKVVKSEEDDDFEFDVMFVLKIPEGCELQLVEIPGRHGYALLKVENGWRGSPDYYRSINHKFFAGCLTFENGMCIVDAGKTTAAFFGELQKWMNTKPIPGYDLRPKQHGTAIQMDVIPELKYVHSISYSVDIAPTFEISEWDGVRRYVAKPEKKRTPDSITWRRLFDSENNISVPIQLAMNALRSAGNELRKQLFEYCASCKGICQGSCIVQESARTCLPLPDEYLMKLQDALIRRGSSDSLTSINLQELNNSKIKRLVAVHYFFENELEVIPVQEKAGHAWLKFGKDAMEASVCSRFDKASKLCYLPGGKYLDIKAASDLLVQELRDTATGLFTDEEVIVRRDGPNVRIDLYPERGNKMLYYCLDIVLAVNVDGNFYIGLPHDYDDVTDKKAWRRSYSYEETEKIRQAPEGLKMVFRVLKALRNREPGLAQLTSYHFKTLLLNMQELGIVNWNDNIDKILVRVLKYLMFCLSEKKLRTHFIPEINLLENITNDCSVNMKSRIEELLRSKRKMLKALKFHTMETTQDILKKHDIRSVQLFPESVPLHACHGSLTPHIGLRSHGSLTPHIGLRSEIEKQLFGYDYRKMTSNPVYEDITAYRICSNESEFLNDFDAIMVINNNKNDLRACQDDYNPCVTRLNHCSFTLSTSLRQTMTHSFGLADTRKTAEYIRQQMKKLIDKSTLLRNYVSVYLEGSNIVLTCTCRSMPNIDIEYNRVLPIYYRYRVLPVYEVGDGFFAALPDVTDTNAWIALPFTPVRNKYWKAFQINECGRRVLSKLLAIRNREPRLAKLSERHLRMAIFWEMDIERDWSDEKVEERFRDVLDRLLVSVKKKNLQDYFYPEINTLRQF